MKEFVWNMETVDGIEKEKGTDTLVEIFAAAAKGIEGGALRQELGQREVNANLIERLIAEGGIGRGDDSNQIRHSSADSPSPRPSPRGRGRSFLARCDASPLGIVGMVQVTGCAAGSTSACRWRCWSPRCSSH